MAYACRFLDGTNITITGDGSDTDPYVINSSGGGGGGGGGTLLGYSEVVANQGPFTAATDLTGLASTVNVIAGHTIKITGHVHGSSTANDDGIQLSIREGGTTLQLDRETLSTVGAGLRSLFSEVVETPSAGSHTYKLTMERSDGSGNITMQAGATIPAYILVEDITVTGGAGAAADAATVVTSQSTSSTSFTDLATVGPAVTMTTGTRVLVLLTARIVPNTVHGQAYMAVAVSGATTLAAAVDNAVEYQAYAVGSEGHLSAAILLTGLTAGSNIFTAKYKVTVGSSFFEHRTLAVIPL